MPQHVTVVPCDNLIFVDGVPLQFAFSAPAALHALQWHEGRGVMEWTDDLPWQLTGEDAYAEEVAPYVALWEAEQARRDQLQSLQDQTSRAPEALAASVRRYRDQRMEATDYLFMPDYPLSGEARAAWTAYRQALRDITSQPGFPWSGGGADDTVCPWPQPPAV